MKKCQPNKVSVAVVIAVRAVQLGSPACFAPEPKAVLQMGKRPVRSVAFRPGGKMVAAACDEGRIELREVLSYKRRATLRGHTKSVNSVAFGGDGKVLPSGGEDGTVRLWEMTTAGQKAVPRGAHKSRLLRGVERRGQGAGLRS
jgi:WD40 repeat protein